MSDTPSVFRDLPADSFPFHVEFYDDEGHLIHHYEVTGPGVMEIPPLSEIHGPVHCQTTYPNGDRIASLADGTHKFTTKDEFSLCGYLMGRAAGNRAVIPPRDDWSNAPPGFYDDNE